MRPKNKIDVQYAVNPVGLPTKQDILRWVNFALANQNRHAELCVRIVDLEESARLNQQYRRKHGATNVLSFPAELPEMLDSPFIGDIVVCAPRVEMEAKQQHKIIHDHWAHLIVHGVLHLLGYDHDSADNAKRMESIEVQLLAHWGVADPYLTAQASV